MAATLPKYSISNVLQENDVSTRMVPSVKFLSEEEIIEVSTKYELFDAIIQFTELLNKLNYQLDAVRSEKMTVLGKSNEIGQQLRMLRLVQDKDASGSVEPVRYHMASDLFGMAHPLYDGTVNLWLGANVMLELTYAEAASFLAEQQASADKGVSILDRELEHIRKQTVNCELNVSRLKASDATCHYADGFRREEEAAANCQLVFVETAHVVIHGLHRRHLAFPVFLLTCLVSVEHLWRQFRDDASSVRGTR